MFYHKVCNSPWGQFKRTRRQQQLKTVAEERAKEKANFKRSETGIIPERIVTVEVPKNVKVFTGWKSG